MDLIKDIKRNRLKHRQKEPLKKDIFNQISSIVKRYELNKNFLKVLDGVEDYLSNVNLNANRVRVKASMESPLFSLVTKDEYMLTISIIKKIGNSYLKFAYSPEEILLCGPLFRLNPSLTPENLERYHFETLFLHERVKADNKEHDEISNRSIEDT
ncbi:MAG: hypothetical protein JSW04_13540 [Desulfobacterales bacterium]|nr:MAG: hypothetical protein JSW04_13540 [Desulfobacterales bacterium]